MGVFEFLKQVCGVEDLILPKLRPSSVAKTPAMVVFVVDMSAAEFTASYKAFFEKIMAAMGLDRDQISVNFEGEELAIGPKTKACIYFGFHQGAIGWREAQPCPTLYVYSLSEMMAQPELKKRTWNLLKDLSK